jgi:hypothetical protein
MEYNESIETKGNPYCYPLYVNEAYFTKGGVDVKLRKLEKQWDMFSLPLDSDIIIELFGEQASNYFSVTNVTGSNGGRGVLVNDRFFEHPLCIGDFVGILWSDRIKLRLTNWALEKYHE